jgi:hypothetical protein
LTLAYPGPSNPTTAIVGRDAFIDVLNNQQMRVRILERELRILEEALIIASRLEAYDRTAPAAVVVEAFDDESGKGRGRHVRNIQVPVQSNSNDAAVEKLSKQIAKLTEAIARSQVGHIAARGPRPTPSGLAYWPTAPPGWQNGPTNWSPPVSTLHGNATNWPNASANWPPTSTTTGVKQPIDPVHLRRKLGKRQPALQLPFIPPPDGWVIAEE